MELTKYYILTLKYPEGSPFAGQTYESSPTPKAVIDSASFRQNFEKITKKVRMIPFDSDQYRAITGLTAEQVNMFLPKPEVKKVVKEEKPFDFSVIEKLNGKENSTVEKPVATKRTYTKRTGKTKTAA